MRALLFAFAVGIGAAVSAAACSDSDDAPAEPAADASVADTFVPDVSVVTPENDADVPDTVLPYDGAAPSVTCGVTPCVTGLTAGPSVYCANISDGSLRCWGDPNVIGDAGLPQSVVDVAISDSELCAITLDGGAQCRPTPLVRGTPPMKHLALGNSQSCAVTTSDQLDCFGGPGDAGVIGLAGDASAVAVGVTDIASFVLDGTGTLQSWGQRDPLLGRSTALFEDDTPRAVISGIRQMAVTATHVCAATTDGRLFCWGHACQFGPACSGNGALLGTGYSRDELFPAQVSFEPGEWPCQVAVSDSHSCVRETDGRVACWGGHNGWGELGFETQTTIYAPLKVSGLPLDVVSVAVGLESTCALAKNGSVFCWGDNRLGQLGQGTTDNNRHPTPVQVKLQ